jgi:hypothetical protein
MGQVSQEPRWRDRSSTSVALKAGDGRVETKRSEAVSPRCSPTAGEADVAGLAATSTHGRPARRELDGRALTKGAGGVTFWMGTGYCRRIGQRRVHLEQITQVVIRASCDPSEPRGQHMDHPDQSPFAYVQSFSPFRRPWVGTCMSNRIATCMCCVGVTTSRHSSVRSVSILRVSFILWVSQRFVCASRWK